MSNWIREILEQNPDLVALPIMEGAGMTEQEYIRIRTTVHIEAAEWHLRNIVPDCGIVSTEEQRALCMKLDELRRRCYQELLITDEE